MKLDKIESPDQFIETVSSAVNIADMLSDSELARIGEEAIEGYNLDYDSMSDWRDKMERGIKLAKLVKQDKNYPFEGAANVKYPLITSAALQFNARAYPAIVPSENAVKVKTFGSDVSGQKAERAERVGNHMSYQLIHEIEEWEEETDKLLVQLPIVGTMVRKVWYDPAQERIRCRVIDAGSFIVNDKAKNLTEAPRVSEDLPLYPHEFRERVASGLFTDIDVSGDDDEEDEKSQQQFIEQHTRLDLDGDDYDEPYIVTVHKATRKVVRIVADFEPRDVTYSKETVTAEQKDPYTFETTPQVIEVNTGVKSIRRGSYFVPYHFLPSMDGGFHGTGLGLLLGDISDAINSIINMMLDAGHMASLGGGFIGSDFRVKGGSQRFRPGEWKKAQVNGADIKNALAPMTFPGPDGTLFQLLGMLIEAGREIASVKDVMTGDSGQKTQTATTTIALIEQGMMVFTASYKRIFRALKREYKLIGGINAETVSAEAYNAFHDPQPDPDTGQVAYFDPAQDYASADMDIAPVADPRSVTKMQEAAKAQFLMGLAEAGMVNPAEASNRMLQAMDIGDRESLTPQPDPMQAKMQEMQMQLEQSKVQADGMKAEADMLKAQAEMIKAQTPVDNSVEAAKLAQDAELAREKMANDTQLAREKMNVDFQSKERDRQLSQNETLVQAGLPPDYSFTDDRQQFAAIMQQMQANEQNMQSFAQIISEGQKVIAQGQEALARSLESMAAAEKAPKRIVRDEQGRANGVETIQ